MANQSQPILDLDVLTARRIVRVAGQNVEMLNPEEMSVFDYHRLGKAWKAVSLVMLKEDPTDDELADAQKQLDYTCRKILLAGDEVHSKLGDTARLRIGQVFMELQRDQAPAAAAVEAPKPEAPPAVEQLPPAETPAPAHETPTGEK